MTTTNDNHAHTKDSIPLLHTVVVAVRERSIVVQYVHEGRRSLHQTLPKEVCVNGKDIKVNDRNVRVVGKFYRDRKDEIAPHWPDKEKD